MKTAAWALALLMSFACAAVAQNQSRIGREFQKEGESLKECFHPSFGNLITCGQTLVMGQPMHITVGSLAPDNGIAAGLALVLHKDFANEWRASWDFDGQASPNGSWRAGGYMKAYRLPGGLKYRVAPLFNLYSQSISLNRVDYYGLGQYTTTATHTTFGFSENITGVNAAIPFNIGNSPKLAIVAELNGRFPSVRGGSESSIPSITRIFNEATAPGLTHQPSYVEPGIGLRIYPELLKDHIRLNYLVQLQEFAAPSDSRYSFRRFTGDFQHEIPLYSWLPGKAGKLYWNRRAMVIPQNGPNNCTGSNASANVSVKHAATAKPNPAVPCPIISTTEKLEGAIRVRVFLSESFAKSGSVVPFYFMPTIGGSDINGTTILASYQDYRFRAPNVLMFRGEFEHSLGKLPVGAYFSADQAKVGLVRDDISIDHFRHSFAAGFTIHAGGLPLITFAYGWGGDNSHVIMTVSPTLLGSSSRPSLY